jgi:hypothetical protein
MLSARRSRTPVGLFCVALRAVLDGPRLVTIDRVLEAQSVNNCPSQLAEQLRLLLAVTTVQ